MARDAWHTGERVVALAEGFVIAPGVRHPNQVAAIIVGPSVVGASERVRVAAIALTDGVAAMDTAVEQEANLAVLVARNDYGLQANLAGHVIAGLRYFTFMRDVDPFVIPDLFDLFVEDFGVVIKTAADSVVENQLVVIDLRAHDGLNLPGLLHLQRIPYSTTQRRQKLVDQSAKTLSPEILVGRPFFDRSDTGPVDGHPDQSTEITLAR